ncbi:MAG: RNase J family beta-CASP ribonuclease [Nitrospirae bacterium]|nr:RNase J family beta-CASP ribonuclease [Nitrospirota bacterium]
MDQIDQWMKRADMEQEKKTSPKKHENTSRSPQKAGPNKKNKRVFSKKRNKPVHKHAQKPAHNRRASVPTKQKRPAKAGHNIPHKPAHKPAHKPVPSPTSKILKGKLKIIPLGGLDEVGKNLMVLEYEDDIIIIDMGFEFPSDDLFGIDYVLPDTTYLEENKKRIRGIVLTHGHLDHIGGLPYILPKLDFPPVYGATLTMGLVQKRIDEFKQQKLAKVHTINPDRPLKLGKFLCNFFRVTHSIPDALGVVVDTPAGKIVHTGDFKFDDTPARNQPKADIHKMQALGRQNVLALFCESTNALKAGHSMSEKKVGETLEKVISEAPGRVIVASFSSQIGRLQLIIDAAAKCNRKLYVSGRSMKTNIEIATKFGSLHVPQGTISDVKKYKKDNDKQTLILTTGSQGEPVSALTRMSTGEHPHVKIKKGDTIIFSSSPIIGNERAIYTTINNLSKLGAEVIHNQIMDVHSSGHGKQEELKKMIDFVRPKYLIPIHGEYYMRKELSHLAIEQCRIPKDKVLMIENGDVLHAAQGKVEKTKEKVETKYILIDGSGEGEIGSHVQGDRAMMSENGTLIMLIHVNKKNKHLRKTPDIVSRGFIYMRESKKITEEIAKVAGEAYKGITKKDPKASRKDIKYYIKQSVDKYTRKKLERRPLIIPLIIEN